MGWEILVVNVGVQREHVTSDPGLYVTPTPMAFRISPSLTAFATWGQRIQSGHGRRWLGRPSRSAFRIHGKVNRITDACMFDTDNDGLEDGEEVIAGSGQLLDTREQFRHRCRRAERRGRSASCHAVPKADQPLINDTDAVTACSMAGKCRSSPPRTIPIPQPLVAASTESTPAVNRRRTTTAS